VTTRTIPRQDIQELKGQTGVKMNAKLFAAVFGASVLMAAPVQAKFIGIAIYDPKVMLPICKNEIAQGRAGVCTGYVIAISEGMTAYSDWVPHDSLCIPSGTTQPREPDHRSETIRSCVAAEILMLTYLPPATCGIVCTSMILPLKDPGLAVPAICRHTAIGMITDSTL
jgi:hypothetical protein